MPELPIFARAAMHAGRVAYRTATTAHTYQHLLDRSAELAATVLDGSPDLAEARVALAVVPGFGYTVAQWGVWRAGGIVVPLSLSATRPEWEYALADSGASIVVADPSVARDLAAACAARGARLLAVDSVAATSPVTLPEVAPARRAMILYTSGTTSKPKGVVTTRCSSRCTTSTASSTSWGVRCGAGRPSSHSQSSMARPCSTAYARVRTPCSWRCRPST
jgi:malonyl-CoA/methylmalonyl-CoA synthetase